MLHKPLYIIFYIFTLCMLLANTINSKAYPAKRNDVFVKTLTNKERVYEQEPIILTYKVYSLMDIIELNGDIPEMKGFQILKVDKIEDEKSSPKKENGKEYKCISWGKYILYPQITGTLKIPSFIIKGTFAKENTDLLEDFFNGGTGYQEIKLSVKVPKASVQVIPLPTRPIDFSGGVGKFEMSVNLEDNHIRAGEPITLRVEVSGIGNLKLIKNPKCNSLEILKDMM